MARRRSAPLDLPRSPSSLCLTTRSTRLRYSLGAAVFVGSDETTVSENQLVLDAFRRLPLQIRGLDCLARRARSARIALGSR